MQLYPTVFTPVTTSNVGPFITRTLGGFNSVSNCLTECFFTSANDCHFAINNGNTCYIGTFKLWPIENPPSYSTATAYIYNGNSSAVREEGVVPASCTSKRTFTVETCNMTNSMRKTATCRIKSHMRHVVCRIFTVYDSKRGIVYCGFTTTCFGRRISYRVAYY